MPGASVSGAIWDSWVNGQNDPGALEIEWSLEEVDYWQPGANCTLTIHGIPFEQIKQSANHSGVAIAIYGGMKPGLPLATAQAPQAGLLIQGQISQCWGNWIGTEMSLGMVITGGGFQGGKDEAGSLTPAQTLDARTTRDDAGALPSALSFAESGLPRFRSIGARSIDVMPFDSGISSALGWDFSTAEATIGGGLAEAFGGGGNIPQPLNVIHNLQPNMPLSTSIKNTLSTMFPQAQLNINISPNLKLPYQDAGMYQSLPQFAAYIKQLSHSILGTNGYSGVHITTHGTSIDVWDGTQQQSGSGGTTIAAQDLIGQPTWIDSVTVQIKTVKRSDIHTGQNITLPPTMMTTTAESIIPNAQAVDQKTNLSFQGTFNVNKVLHIGDFRNPDGNAWCTIYNAQVQSSNTDQQQAAQTADQANQAQNPQGQQPLSWLGAGAGAGNVPIQTMSLRQRSVRHY
jgi:hypothetical protein